jgi:hypothetical protein
VVASIGEALGGGWRPTYGARFATTARDVTAATVAMYAKSLRAFGHVAREVNDGRDLALDNTTSHSAVLDLLITPQGLVSADHDAISVTN